MRILSMWRAALSILARLAFSWRAVAGWLSAATVRLGGWLLLAAWVLCGGLGTALLVDANVAALLAVLVALSGAVLGGTALGAVSLAAVLAHHKSAESSAVELVAGLVGVLVEDLLEELLVVTGGLEGRAVLVGSSELFNGDETILVSVVLFEHLLGVFRAAFSLSTGRSNWAASLRLIHLLNYKLVMAWPKLVIIKL